jgi:hypothetical protein
MAYLKTVLTYVFFWLPNVRYGSYAMNRRECGMRVKGLGYDTGSGVDGVPRPFDHAVVRRELPVIRDDLHCTAVRLPRHAPGTRPHGNE